jgi:hypothetical protein
MGANAGRRRLVDVFAEKSERVADAETLKQILIELDEQDAQWHPQLHRVIAKFLVAIGSPFLIVGSVYVESAAGGTILYVLGMIGWAGFLYDTFGRRAAEFAARLAKLLISRNE